MKVIELHVSNVKRLKAVSLTPQGHTVVIGGQNEQGKSSVLDAILMALAGKDAICEKPIREGQTKAEVTVDLGDLIVTRKFTNTGTTLVVKDKEGKSVSSPQTILDKLVGAIGFDPLSFSRMDSKAQRETLAKLAGLDLSKIQAEYATLYATRRDANRDVDRLNHQLAGRAAVGPYEEISTADLLKQLNDAEAAAQLRLNANRNVHDSEVALSSALQQRDSRQAHVAKIRRELEAAEQSLEEAVRHAEQKAIALQDAKVVAESHPFVDLNPFKAAIANAAEKNAAIRENVKIRDLRIELGRAESKADALQDQIDAKLNEKAEKIATASYPLPGLAVTDDCVLFEGIPLKQASTAQQIKISAAIGIALNPKLRVMLIRDGAFLDDVKLAALREMAEDNDVQLFIERVGKGQECSVVIEDGAIVEDRTKPDVGEPFTTAVGEACCVNAR